MNNEAASVKKESPKGCRFKKSAYLCSVYHSIQATESPITMPAAFFMPLAYRISSVPCGALMRPQPVSGGRQRGTELFLFPRKITSTYVSFNCLPQ